MGDQEITARKGTTQSPVNEKWINKKTATSTSAIYSVLSSEAAKFMKADRLEHLFQAVQYRTDREALFSWAYVNDTAVLKKNISK